MSETPTVIRTRATVGSGGRIVVTDSALEQGATVDVIILLPEPEHSRRSIVDLLAEVNGQQVFHTADEVTIYLREQRDAWDS